MFTRYIPRIFVIRDFTPIAKDRSSDSTHLRNKEKRISEEAPECEGGTPPPTPKLTCFVLYLKIINTFSKKLMCASYSKLSKELKNSITI